jgi:hypothetical protein
MGFNVTTDKSDYQPNDTAVFTASSLNVGGTVIFSVSHVNAGADGIYGTADDLYTNDLTGTGIRWSVTDGGAGDLDGLLNGTVVTNWLINPDALDQAFMLFAINRSTGERATAFFTDAETPSDLPDGGHNLAIANSQVIIEGNAGIEAIFSTKVATVGAGTGLI